MELGQIVVNLGQRCERSCRHVCYWYHASLNETRTNVQRLVNVCTDKVRHVHTGVGRQACNVGKGINFSCCTWRNFNGVVGQARMKKVSDGGGGRGGGGGGGGGGEQTVGLC